MQDYLAEAQTHLDELRQAVESEQQPQVAWLAERLAGRSPPCTAKRPPGRCAPGTAPRRGSEWQRKRLQHQELNAAC
jgi:primosomal replication protein N''